MEKENNIQINAIGREVPINVNGKILIPYKGVKKHKPEGFKHGSRISTCADFPDDGNKLVVSLKEALIRSELQDGMTISTHHHFRNGDLIANEVFKIASELGIKNLIWFPSASLTVMLN